MFPRYETLIDTVREQSTGGHKKGDERMLCFTPKFLPLPFTRVHYTVTSTDLQLKESHQYTAMLGRRRWHALSFTPLCPLQHASQAIVSITLFFLFILRQRQN